MPGYAVALQPNTLKPGQGPSSSGPTWWDGTPQTFFYIEADDIPAARKEAESYSTRLFSDGYWLYETDFNNEIVRQVMPNKAGPFLIFDEGPGPDDKTYHVGGSVWHSNKQRAKLYPDLDAAGAALDEVDCERIMRNRLVIRPASRSGK